MPSGLLNRETHLTMRKLLESTCGLHHLLVLFPSLSVFVASSQAEVPPRQFRVWATSCAHVPADIRRGRESLAKAIRQSEGLEKRAPAFDWDIMIDAGDLDGVIDALQIEFGAPGLGVRQLGLCQVEGVGVVLHQSPVALETVFPALV